jgi:hypothetical protein
MSEPQLEFSAVLTAKEAAARLRVSLSWLAKSRMRGDGPPYIRIGRSIRYTVARCSNGRSRGSVGRRARNRHGELNPLGGLPRRLAHLLQIFAQRPE